MSALEEMMREYEPVAQFEVKHPVAVVLGRVFDGAVLGLVTGFLVYRDDKAHRRLLKHAMYGAIAGGAFGALDVHSQKSNLETIRRLSQHHVGAPGQDYSFTRRPGYNDKNY